MYLPPNNHSPVGGFSELQKRSRFIGMWMLTEIPARQLNSDGKERKSFVESTLSDEMFSIRPQTYSLGNYHSLSNYLSVSS